MYIFIILVYKQNKYSDFKRIKWKEQCRIAFQLEFYKFKSVSYSLTFPISFHWIYYICSLTWVTTFYKCAMFTHHAKTNFQYLRTWPGHCKESSHVTRASHVLCGQQCLYKPIYTLTSPSLLHHCEVGKMSWLWSITRRRHFILFY